MGTCYGRPQKELDEHIASKSVSELLTVKLSRIPHGSDDDVDARQPSVDDPGRAGTGHSSEQDC